MGWLSVNSNLLLPIRLLSGDSTGRLNEKDQSSQHVETLETQEYPFQELETADDSLPKIEADVVRATKQDPDKFWIVVDDVVYDCSNYIWEHPGGKAVIESFRGENCSWQFWRFHPKTIMQEFGRPLRIGRTEGIVNRFKERPRFVGLRKVGQDDDW
jgi:cytochrome b involved in lipid metabolism